MAKEQTGRASHSISLVWEFQAPRSEVFRYWLQPEGLSTWFAPDGFEVTHCEVDPRPDGAWLVRFQSATGETHDEFGTYREILEPERLAFTLTQRDQWGSMGPRTLVEVDFLDKGATTQMRFRQSGYDSAEMRDGNAEGWRECFFKLQHHLGGRQGPSA